MDPLKSLDQGHEWYNAESLTAYNDLKDNFAAPTVLTPTSPPGHPPTKSLCYHSLTSRFMMVQSYMNYASSSGAFEELWMGRSNDAMVWAVRWLTKDCGPQEKVDIFNKCCSCDRLFPWQTLAAHDVALTEVPQMREQAGRRLIDQIFLLFVEIANDVSELDLMRSRRLSRRKRWPRHISHLLPNGPQVSFGAIVQWLNVALRPGPDLDLLVISTRILQSIEIILRVAHSVLMPSASDWSELLFLRIVNITRNANTLWHKDMPTGPCASGNCRVLPIITCMYNAALVLKHLRDYTVTVLMKDYVKTQELRQDLVNAGAVGIRLLFELNYHISREQFTEAEASGLVSRCSLAVACYAEMAAVMIDVLPKILSQDSVQTVLQSRQEQLYRISLYHCFSTLPQHMAHFYLLRDLFILLHKDRKCRRPGCTKTDVDLDRTMRVCTGCYRLQYCSRRCQKLAWDHPVCGHRESCSTISNVCLRLPIPRRSLRSWEDLENARDRPLRADAQRYEVLVRQTRQKLSALLRCDMLMESQ